MGQGGAHRAWPCSARPSRKARTCSGACYTFELPGTNGVVGADDVCLVACARRGAESKPALCCWVLGVPLAAEHDWDSPDLDGTHAIAAFLHNNLLAPRVLDVDRDGRGVGHVAQPALLRGDLVRGEVVVIAWPPDIDVGEPALRSPGVGVEQGE